MTIENFYRADKLTTRIRELERRIKRLRELIKRVNEIAVRRVEVEKQERMAEIQLAEKMANTPRAIVGINDFIDYLNYEIVRVSKEIEICNKEFAEL